MYFVGALHIQANLNGEKTLWGNLWYLFGLTSDLKQPPPPLLWAISGQKWP